MLPISAADSVSPAIQRTRDLLFRPFRWGTYLKLGLVAIITEGIGSNLHSSKRATPSVGHGPMTYPQFNIPPVWIAAAVAAVLVVIVLSIVVFYLVTRLRFAFFHCLIHNTSEIGPGWRLYRTQAARFFGLNLVVAFSYVLLFGLAMFPFMTGFIRVVRETPPGSQPDLWKFLPLILPLIPIILLIALIAFVLEVILRDFILPHYALEDATVSEAWQEVWEQIKAEKKQFAVYALLRLILPISATIGLFIVFLLPGLMLAGSLAAVEYAIHSAFANLTGVAALPGILLEAFFGVLAFAFALFVGVCLGGPLSTGLREYALIFYGGRYQALGNILYPPPAAIAPEVP
jgi:hypothetical protein